MTVTYIQFKKNTRLFKLVTHHTIIKKHMQAIKLRLFFFSILFYFITLPKTKQHRKKL